MSGVFYGVGVGPGDPELMTLKAVRLIKEADCIVLPGASKENCRAYDIAVGAIEDFDKKDLTFIPFPMKMNKEMLDDFHRVTADKIENMLDEDKMVCFLTIGDPSIYSTLMYVKDIVEEDGYNCELVSGVSSFCAAATKLGISLGQGDTPISIIPGSFAVEKSADFPGTRVFMKSGKKVAELREELIKEADSRKCHIHCVSNCGMENESIVHGVEELSDKNGYLSVIIAIDEQID